MCVCVANLHALECAALPTDKEVKIQMALLDACSLSNETFVFLDFYVSRGLDLMFLTETWMCEGDVAPLTELCPSDSSFFSFPRLCRRGGGIASLFKDTFKCQRTFDHPSYSSFEVQLKVILLHRSQSPK